MADITIDIDANTIVKEKLNNEYFFKKLIKDIVLEELRESKDYKEAVQDNFTTSWITDTAKEMLQNKLGNFVEKEVEQFMRSKLRTHVGKVVSQVFNEDIMRIFTNQIKGMIVVNETAMKNIQEDLKNEIMALGDELKESHEQ